MKTTKKVCIVGAGLSGITTIKQLKEEGHQVTCFEKSEGIGGVFGVNKHYDDLHLTISNYFMAYSDYVPSKERLKFWSKLEYRNYLHEYCDKFGLMEHIHLNTSIESIQQNDDSSWTVVTESEGESTTEVYDAVVACSGLFQTPKMPDFEGLDEFEGNVIHSQQYREQENYRGKKVLCIGLGESSSDITSEVSAVAEKCILSLRRYQAVAPRYMAFQEDPYFTIDTSWLTSRIVNKLPKSFHFRSAKKIFKKYLESKNIDVRIRGSWLLHSGSPVNQAVTKNERVFKHIADGHVTPNIGGIERFDETGVVFKDGTREDIDEVICCTGYQLNFPFTDIKINNMRDLFKQMFIPEIGPSLSFVGFVRPQQGGIPVIAEMQSRYLAQILSEQQELPSIEDQKQTIVSDAEFWKKEYYVTPNVASLVNYCHYMDSLAKLVGCMPEIPSFWENPKLRIKLLHGPQFAAQYRLNGPHSVPEKSRKFLLSFPGITSTSKIIYLEISLFFCKLFNWVPKWHLRYLD
ncbi:MAG: NAD(P)-binding domain-containing protein [bacterium]|nr:NAD(P)-binding domain-containing protein [bacterium]